MIKRLKNILSQYFEKARIVSGLYGVNRAGMIISMLWCRLRYGATPVDYVRFEFYKKKPHERNRYLTHHLWRKMFKEFGYYITREKTYGKIAIYRTFADYIHRPWIVADKDSDPQAIKDYISKQGIVFAKPDHSSQGRGVVKIKAEDNAAIEELLNDSKQRAFVVEGAIVQAPEIAAINPSSINTIRAFTLIKRDGTTQIISILLRVGMPGMVVDNWGSGGVCYNFDLATGICDRAGVDKKQQPYLIHPGSNFQMVGFRLPNFDKLKQLILEISQKVPQARFVGWDIAITPDGYELVEMNCPGGHDILQPFGTPYGDLLKRELT